jgi:hypothetical protein
MNCQIIQRRLLGAEDPEHLSVQVQAHVDACSACREWLARLVQVEQNVRLLPVPQTQARAAFVQQLLRTETSQATPPPVTVPDRSRARTPRPKPVIRRIPNPAASNPGIPVPWRFAAAVMAASLLLFAFAWWTVRETRVGPQVVEKPRPDPLVASLVKHNLKLASAKEPGERAAELKAIDDELIRERQTLDGDADTNELVADFDNWHHSVVAGVACPATAAESRLDSGTRRDGNRAGEGTGPFPPCRILLALGRPTGIGNPGRGQKPGWRPGRGDGQSFQGLVV